jgi:hypothetical protein
VPEDRQRRWCEAAALCAGVAVCTWPCACVRALGWACVWLQLPQLPSSGVSVTGPSSCALSAAALAVTAAADDAAVAAGAAAVAAAEGVCASLALAVDVLALPHGC